MQAEIAGRRIRTEGSVGPVEVDLRWLVPAAGSVLALAVLAPGGLALLAFLGLVIALHEAGHFVVARRSGIQPTEFFWGFGPPLLSVRVGSCRYGIRALFLGGFVRLEGMTPTSELPDGFDEAGTYRAASHRSRLATILAGPGINLVTGWLAFAGGRVVAGGSPGSAMVRGLGDAWAVVEATGWSLLTLAANLGGYVQAVLDQSGQTDAPVRFLSPVAQAQTSQLAIELGPDVVLQWFGILSVAVGVINLVPLPPLDGGHAVVAAADGALGRLRRDEHVRLDANRLVPLAWITVVVLVALSVSALVLDLRDLA
ncbi:MAG: site-2 protease family protein [Actinomycetota bacterium]